MELNPFFLLLNLQSDQLLHQILKTIYKDLSNVKEVIWIFLECKPTNPQLPSQISELGGNSFTKNKIENKINL